MATPTNEKAKEAVVTPSPSTPESVATVVDGPAKAGAEMVSIPASDLAAVMDRLQKLESDAQLVMQVQDKNKINKIEELRRGGKLIKSVKVRKIGTKYVLGWATIEDTVYRDENGKVIEKQTIKVMYDDDTESEMSLRQWVTAAEYVPFDVKGEEKDEDGNLFFKIVSPDGKEIKLNASFVN